MHELRPRKAVSLAGLHRGVTCAEMKVNILPGNVLLPRGLDFFASAFSFQTLILPSTSAVMSELSVVEDAPAVADPSAVLPAASANGSANGAAMHLLAANCASCHGLAFPCTCVCHSW